MDFLEYVLLTSSIEIGGADKDHLSILWTPFVKGVPTAVRGVVCVCAAARGDDATRVCCCGRAERRHAVVLSSRRPAHAPRIRLRGLQGRSRGRVVWSHVVVDDVAVAAVVVVVAVQLEHVHWRVRAAQSQPLGQPRPVKTSTLSATSVGVFLQYLLEANRIAGSVKVKQSPVKTAADDGSAPFVAGVGGVVDAALKVFPVKGVRMQLTPGEGFVSCHVAPFATVLPCLSLKRRCGCCTLFRICRPVRRRS